MKTAAIRGAQAAWPVVAEAPQLPGCGAAMM